MTKPKIERVLEQEFRNSLKFSAIMEMQIELIFLKRFIEATKHIRQMDSESAEIPIIAVTANAFKSDEEHCAEAGMNAHLSKPFDINKLMEVLTSLLDLEYTEDKNVQ